MALTDKLTALGDAIRGKTELTDKMTIDQMTEAITNLEVNPAPNVEEITITNNGTYTPNEGVDGFNRVVVNVPVDLGDLPEDLLHLTGNQSYRFYQGSWNSFLNKYGNQITTENLTDISYMFRYNNGLQNIPFALNMSKTGNCNLSSAFNSMINLEYLPTISDCKVANISDMCNGCYNLKEININFDNWDLSTFGNNSWGGYEGNWHSQCYSLRQIPMSYYNKLFQTKTVGKTSPYYSIYYNLAYNCYNIDEIIDMPVMVLDKYTSNAFNGTFTGALRLKNFTFKVQEDGTPYSANWKSQEIDLSKAGFSRMDYDWYHRDEYLYNSGITIDKCIYNDETYQALKDDPDSYVAGYQKENPHYYSRYNKASAIRTINSLPDVSASGGTNTIKFKGEAGLRTDGGAINTMTEEEIVVATSKGWTVSFV